MSNEKTEKQLYSILAKVSDAKDMEKLFIDLCTYNEIEQLSERLMAAKLMLEGKTYAQITALTGISSATLGRISRCIRHGSGGYKDVLQKMLSEGESDDK